MKTVKTLKPGLLQKKSRYAVVQFENGFYGITDRKSAFPSKVIIAGCATIERALAQLKMSRYDWAV